jgi:hypothetical protein
MAIRVALPDQQVLDKRLAAADRPGEHIWIVVASWRITEPASMARSGDAVNLDAENLLSLAGPGCFKCEKPYSSSLAKRRCLGSVEPED